MHFVYPLYPYLSSISYLQQKKPVQIDFFEI